jgi:hypothetical protein
MHKGHGQGSEQAQERREKVRKRRGEKERRWGTIY